MTPDQITVGPGGLERSIIERSKPKQVLLVDDSHDDMLMVQTFAKPYNCVITWAKNYEEAVSILTKQGRNFFALILLDLRLGSYEECFRVFEYISKDDLAPVLVLSGQLDTLVMDNLLSIGFAGFVRKPLVGKDNYFATYFQRLFKLVDIKPKLNA